MAKLLIACSGDLIEEFNKTESYLKQEKGKPFSQQVPLRKKRWPIKKEKAEKPNLSFT